MLKINEIKNHKGIQESPFNKGAGTRRVTGGSLKAQRGITLIALIITIIIMLILVAVTITAAVNGGLFEYAGRAGRETNEAIKAEQQLADGKVKVGDKWYASIDAYLAGKELIELPEGIKVGDYVNYTPDVGTYTVASGSTGSGYTSNQTFTTEVDDEEAGTSALKWRILSIDEETGEIEIVSAKAAQRSKKLYLSGADGYNHGVDILNDLCETLYSKTVNGTKVATGRSINVEDINAKTTFDPSVPFSYEKYGTPFESSSKHYPNLYEAEIGSTANGLDETADLLKGSDRVETGTVNDSGVTEYFAYTGSTPASTLYATATAYKYKPESSSYLNTNLGINTAPTGLIMVGAEYWVASRFVMKGVVDSRVHTRFGLRIVYQKGYMDVSTLFDSRDLVGHPGRAVRPVVSLGSNVKMTKDTTNSDESVTYWNVGF